ncbi:retrovirus-related pol polyprotein from transposon TNT 1-94 [Tanacetum coccineum]
MAKASPTQAWLWHRRLSHLNFNTINLLFKKDIVNGLPKLKYVKDQLCPSYEIELEIQDHNNEPSSSKLVPNVVPLADMTDTSLQELDLLFSHMYEEYFTAGNQSVSKSSALSDNLQQQDTQPTLNVQPTLEPTTPPTNVNAEENNIDQAADTQFQPYEFINPFCTSVQEVAESSSRNIDTSNMHIRKLTTDPEMCMFALIMRTAEPTNIKEEMVDHAWINAMQEELHQFDKLKVWKLVDNPFGKIVINLKWLWKNKKDEDNTEEVYVNQPDGFVDFDHLEKVYRLKKALYGLKQPPRAWYNELSTFLMSKGFTKGTIDPTLFMLRYGEDILLVQIYAKYALEILKKHRMDKCDNIGTPMATKPKLDADLSGTPIDQTRYHSMIGSLMYLTSSRPDIVQVVCYCARYQARPTEKHLKEVKIIFRYLKVTINMRLWYPKDSGFELTAFSDADHAGCLDTRKSTFGGIQFLGDKLEDGNPSGANIKQALVRCPRNRTAEAEYVELSASCAQHSRTKNVNVRYHFIKEHVERGIIELYFIRTEYQLADMFTKALSQERFEYLVR